MAFWTYIDVSSELASGMNIIWGNHLSITLIKDKSNPNIILGPYTISRLGAQVHERGPCNRPAPPLEHLGVNSEALVGDRRCEQKREALGDTLAPRGECGRVQHLARVYKRDARDDGRYGRPCEPHVRNHELACTRVEQRTHQEHLQCIQANRGRKDTARYADGNVAQHDRKGGLERCSYVFAIEHESRL